MGFLCFYSRVRPIRTLPNCIAIWMLCSSSELPVFVARVQNEFESLAILFRIFDFTIYFYIIFTLMIIT